MCTKYFKCQYKQLGKGGVINPDHEYLQGETHLLQFREQPTFIPEC